MKRKHTQKKSANRMSAVGRASDTSMSRVRWEKRQSFHKVEKKSFGRQVRRVQTIKMNKHSGTMIVTTVVKFIDHCEK